LIIRLPSLRDEAVKIAELLAASHAEGHAWGDMAVVCRHHTEMDRVAAVLRHRQLPHDLRRGATPFNPLADTIKILTMHVSKGLEFPVVALCGVGQMPARDADPVEEARLFYVAATRATQRLFVPLSGDSAFARRLAA
jgi:superfamily I DNA/RNA helicase